MENIVSYRIANALIIHMPKPKIIEPGTKFGKLTFIKWIPNTTPRQALYKCECGNEKVLIASNVTTGRTISCGCIAGLGKTTPIKPGDVFGFWTVLGNGQDRFAKSGHIIRTKKCKCICGKIKDVDVTSLRNKTSRSCGCMNSTFMKPKQHLGKPLIVHGYRVVYRPKHKYATRWICSPGYVYEHRYVIECFLGRALKDDEHVHHKDGNKLNNSLYNLEVLSREEHARLHHPKHKIALNDTQKRPQPHWYDGLTQDDIRNLIARNSYESIGRQFGVTGAAIKRKALRMGIKLDNRLSREYLIASGRMAEIKKNFTPSLGEYPRNAKAIIRISPTGDTVTYPAMKKAEKDGFSSKSIRRHINSDTPYKGFIWKEKCQLV